MRQERVGGSGCVMFPIVGHNAAAESGVYATRLVSLIGRAQVGSAWSLGMNGSRPC